MAERTGSKGRRTTRPAEVVTEVRIQVRTRQGGDPYVVLEADGRLPEVRYPGRQSAADGSSWAVVALLPALHKALEAGLERALAAGPAKG